MTIRMPFILPPEQITKIKQGNIEGIVAGEHIDTHSEWLLEGSLNEEFNPTIAVAFFPDIFYAGFTPDKPSSEGLLEYRKKINKIILPNRILALERSQYQQYSERGDEILNRLLPAARLNLMPIAMIVFSQPSKSGTESAYLMCPIIIPPSAAFRFIKKNSRIDG